MPLRKDGNFEIYKIQTRYPNYKNGSWFFANLDHFGYPGGFSASDECWQITGETGTFNKEIAISGLKWISDKYPNQQFRIVKQVISQKTVPVITNKVIKESK